MPDATPTSNPPSPSSDQTAGSGGRSRKQGKTATRFIQLGERWAAETTKIAGFVDATKNVLEASTRQSEAATTAIVRLEAAIAGLSTAVADLKTHCRKRTGIPAILDWAYEKAKESPQTFLLVVMSIVTMLALAGAFGWNVSKFLGLSLSKASVEKKDPSEKPVEPIGP
jgi:hypothetical protein